MGHPSCKRRRNHSSTSCSMSSIDDTTIKTEDDENFHYDQETQNTQGAHEEEEEEKNVDDGFHPEEHEPNTFCCTCREAFGSNRWYLVHMWDVHKLVCCQIQPTVFYHNRTPDVNDPDLKCNVCDIGFRYSTHFRNHMQRIHNMKLPPPIKPYITDPQLIAELTHTYCRNCEKKFDFDDDFCHHMENVHKMTKLPTLINRNDWPPKLV